MALANTFLNLLGAVGSFLKYSWPFILLIALFIAKKRWSKYPIDCIIFEKRKNNLVKTNDRVGIIEDKLADMTFYKFLKSKETYPVLNYDLMLHTNPKPTNILERLINILRPTAGTLFLFKYGTRQYKPIEMGLNKSAEGKLKLVEVKDKKGEPVYQYHYIGIDPRNVLGDMLEFETLDFDNMNFMAQEIRATAIRRQKRGEWLKTLAIPAMIIAGAVVAAIFIMKFSADAGADLRGGGGAPQTDTGGSAILGAIQGGTGIEPGK